VSERSPTRAALLTAAGRAAVATVLVSGPDAAQTVDALFHPANGRPWLDEPPDRIHFGRWQSASAGEEVIVCRRGEWGVEVHCHGGHAAARAILDSLIERGARETDWRDLTRRAAPNSIAAEAEIALAAAPTDRTATILWDQRSGAWQRACDALATLVAAGDAARAIAACDELLALAPLGRHLVEPWQVVLVGRPNAGKSSLINALLGYRRAIVHDTPGTTRDLVSAATAFDGWPVELVDTAGLKSTDDPIESAGIALARTLAREADLVVRVIDASTPASEQDPILARQWPEALVVRNKCDLPPTGPSCAGSFATSATRGDGLTELQAAIVQRLVPRPPPAGQAVPFLPFQAELLGAVRGQLVDGSARAALELLARPENSVTPAASSPA
jgi:tRNA modification GTPase